MSQIWLVPLKIVFKYQNLSRRSIETDFGGFETRLNFIKFELGTTTINLFGHTSISRYIYLETYLEFVYLSNVSNVTEEEQ